jgi:hypothetical protein
MQGGKSYARRNDDCRLCDFEKNSRKSFVTRDSVDDQPVPAREDDVLHPVCSPDERARYEMGSRPEPTSKNLLGTTQLCETERAPVYAKG